MAHVIFPSYFKNLYLLKTTKTAEEDFLYLKVQFENVYKNASTRNEKLLLHQKIQSAGH